MTAPARIASYRIERLLGVGSFATVWLGLDESLDARVAIKVLADNWSHDLRVRERFLDEARLLWRLDHDRVVRVHAFGELADGRPYLVMTWADRGSLRDRLAAGPVTRDEGVRLLREIAAGVAVLHDNGIVHRDLSPGNVLFRSRSWTANSAGDPVESIGPVGDQVLIADLGLAKNLAAASGVTARAGTPGYMAPEQDDPLAVVDARADVYGLGRLAGDLLGAEPGTEPVAAVLRRATAIRPEDRYANARAFAAAFDQAVGQHGLARMTWRWRRVLLAAIVLLLVLAATTVLLWRRPPAAGNADPTGRITVTLPDGWRARGAGWSGQYGPDGKLEPALVMSPDPDRWADDPALPGSFVGLSPTLAMHTTPARYVAEHQHQSCEADPLRTTRQGGVDWVIARYANCGGGKPAVVEAAGLAASGAGLVYVQIAPPPGSDSSFVDNLLAGIRIR